MSEEQFPTVPRRAKIMSIEIDEISERLGDISSTLRAIQRQIDAMIAEQARVQEAHRKMEAAQLLANTTIQTWADEIAKLKRDIQELRDSKLKVTGAVHLITLLVGGGGGFGLSRLLDFLVSVHH